MQLLNSTYLGTRIAMLDALQRIGSSECDHDTSEIIPMLQRAIREACADNRLLGARGALVGEAWARFIATRPPEAILAFVNHAEVKRAVENLPLLVDRVETMSVPRALSLLAFKFQDSRAMTSGFEDIAQETGLIDYLHGETLAGHLSTQLEALEQESSTLLPAEKPEHASVVPGIRTLYDSHYGNVEAHHLGLTPEQMEAAMQPKPPTPDNGRSR